MNSLIHHETASFPETEKHASIIIGALADKEVSIGQGLLACCLTMCRLLNPTKDLRDEEEIEFIQALMEWLGAYFTEGRKN